MRALLGDPGVRRLAIVTAVWTAIVVALGLLLLPRFDPEIVPGDRLETGAYFLPNGTLVLPDMPPDEPIVVPLRTIRPDEPGLRQSVLGRPFDSPQAMQTASENHQAAINRGLLDAEDGFVTATGFILTQSIRTPLADLPSWVAIVLAAALYLLPIAHYLNALATGEAMFRALRSPRTLLTPTASQPLAIAGTLLAFGPPLALVALMLSLLLEPLYPTRDLLCMIAVLLGSVAVALLTTAAVDRRRAAWLNGVLVIVPPFAYIALLATLAIRTQSDGTPTWLIRGAPLITLGLLVCLGLAIARMVRGAGRPSRVVRFADDDPDADGASVVASTFGHGHRDLAPRFRPDTLRPLLSTQDRSGTAALVGKLRPRSRLLPMLIAGVLVVLALGDAMIGLFGGADNFRSPSFWLVQIGCGLLACGALASGTTTIAWRRAAVALDRLALAPVDEGAIARPLRRSLVASLAAPTGVVLLGLLTLWGLARHIAQSDRGSLPLYALLTVAVISAVVCLPIAVRMTLRRMRGQASDWPGAALAVVVGIVALGPLMLVNARGELGDLAGNVGLWAKVPLPLLLIAVWLLHREWRRWETLPQAGG